METKKGRWVKRLPTTQEEQRHIKIGIQKAKDQKGSIRSQTMIMLTGAAQVITGLLMARAAGMQIQMMEEVAIKDIKVSPITTGNKKNTGKYDRQTRKRRRNRIYWVGYREIEG